MTAAPPASGQSFRGRAGGEIAAAEIPAASVVPLPGGTAAGTPAEGVITAVATFVPDEAVCAAALPLPLPLSDATATGAPPDALAGAVCALVLPGVECGGASTGIPPDCATRPELVSRFNRERSARKSAACW